MVYTTILVKRGKLFIYNVKPITPGGLDTVHKSNDLFAWENRKKREWALAYIYI